MGILLFPTYIISRQLKAVAFLPFCSPWRSWLSNSFSMSLQVTSKRNVSYQQEIMQTPCISISFCFLTCLGLTAQQKTPSCFVHHMDIQMLLSISTFTKTQMCSAGTLSLGLSIALDPVAPQLWSQLCTRIHLVPCAPGICHGHGCPAQTQPNPWLISLPFLGKSRSCEDVLSGTADENVQHSFQTHDEAGHLKGRSISGCIIMSLHYFVRAFPHYSFL